MSRTITPLTSGTVVDRLVTEGGAYVEAEDDTPIHTEIEVALQPLRTTTSASTAPTPLLSELGEWLLSETGAPLFSETYAPAQG